MKMHSDNRKDGGILLMVMFVVLIFSVLAIGLFKLHETNAVESVYAKQSKQAFWLAEAGLQEAIHNLNWDADYRDNPWDFTRPYGVGTFDVIVSDIQAHPTIAHGTNYTVVSVGNVRGFNRRVQQMITATPGSKFAIIGKSGDSKFNSNSEVHGSIIHFNGSVDTGNNGTVVVDDYIFSDTVTGNGSYTQAEVPPLDPPTLNTSMYTDQINAVVNNPLAPPLLEKIATALSGTANYDANVTFKNALTIASGTTIISTGDIVFSSSITFSGPVTIKAGGNVIFNRKIAPLPTGSTIISKGNIALSSQTELGSNVKIYSGNNFSIGSTATIGSGTIIYANNNLTFASGGANTIDGTGAGIALLSNGSITINSNMNPFTGIMYANTGQVNLNANIDIYGTVVGGLGFDAASNVDFFYYPKAFGWDLAGIGISFGDVLLEKGIWQELPPL